MPPNILNSPDFKIQRVEKTDHNYHVYVKISNFLGVYTACDYDARTTEKLGNNISTLIELLEFRRL